MSDVAWLWVSVVFSVVGVILLAVYGALLLRTPRPERSALQSGPRGRGLLGAGALSILVGVLARLVT